MSESPTIYSFSARSLDGTEIEFEKYRGRVLLIVNVASQCGFTSQYSGLEELHRKYSSEGLSVMGFPCNQFGFQEPGSDQDIQKFCSTKYEVGFDMFSKVNVNGQEAHPLFQFLKQQSPGVLGTEGIKWNFTKFLVGRNGQVIRRFGSMETPAKIEAEVVQALRCGP